MASYTKSLAGKIAVITGANTGIGFATLQRFLKEGAQVIGFDKNIQQASKLTHCIQGDVTHMKDLVHLYDEIDHSYGHIDVLFANTGICKLSDLEHVTEAGFQEQFDVNVKGMFFTVQRALPLIQPNGAIIMTSSMASIKGFENNGVYSATKAAVRSFTRTLTNELRYRNIRVNAVAPGAIMTPIFEKLNIPLDERKALLNSLGKDIPLGRPGTAEEVANAVCFLASSEASYINGIELVVDGGMVEV